MKAACLLLLTIGWAVLMCGADHAATSDPGHQPMQPGANSQGSLADSAQDLKNGERSDEHRDSRHILGKNLLPGHVTVARTRRPIPVPSNRMRSGSATAINLQKSGPSRLGSAEVKGLVQNRTVKGALPVRPSNAVRPTIATLGGVRHRSPNPAILDGLMNTRSRSTGGITGTRMKGRR